MQYADRYGIFSIPTIMCGNLGTAKGSPWLLWHWNCTVFDKKKKKKKKTLIDTELNILVHTKSIYTIIVWFHRLYLLALLRFLAKQTVNWEKECLNKTNTL